MNAWITICGCIALAIGNTNGGVRTEDGGPTTPPAPIGLTVKLPKVPPTLEALNSGEYEILVEIENTSKTAQVVSPYLRVEIGQGDEAVVKPTRQIGRFGRRAPGCFLAKLKFETIPPGKHVTRRVNLASYMLDPEFILAWTLTRPGTYELRFAYAHDPKPLVARCPEGCASHLDPASPWNQAWAGKTQGQVLLIVSE